MTLAAEEIAATWATLNTLTESRCMELLSQRRWGRFGASFGGWPVVFPVNYGFDGENLVMKTATNAKTIATPITPVAFEIDDADVGGAWGWSVLVQGPAIDITDGTDQVAQRLRAVDLKNFAPGHKERWIRIPALRISGRSFGDVPGWS